MKKLGAILITFSIAFSILETVYFNCNFTPMSYGEKICDIVALSTFVIGTLLYIKGKKFKTG